MVWKAVKHALQPTPGDAWYASDGDNLLHCGIGEDGEARAKAIAERLNMVPVVHAARNEAFRRDFEAKLREFAHAATALDPDILPNLPEGSDLYGVLTAIRNLKDMAMKLQLFVTEAPRKGR